MTAAQTEEKVETRGGTSLCPVSRSALVEPRRAKAWIAAGVFFVVFGLYALSSPGRIDTFDGQARFNVAYNWLVTGRPTVQDHWVGLLMGVPGVGGLPYAHYGAPASVFAMPLVGLGILTSAPAIQPTLFLFSLTSSIFGAALASLLFLFYVDLGVTARRAVAWTMVSSFATYLWPISNSAFDNAQHAFFTLASVYLGLLSARRKSFAYAAAAGFAAGILVLYQEYFLAIVPALALSTIEWKSSLKPANTEFSNIRRASSAATRAFQTVWALLREAWDGRGDARSSCARSCLFLASASVGVILTLAYNHLRFGSWLFNGKTVGQSSEQIFGNPLSGFLTLLVSPGKSVFLYSPVVVLGVVGIWQLWKRVPELALVIASASLILVLLISCIAFAGGDWCWGPRYLTPLLPLWALAFPFQSDTKLPRRLLVAIVSLGFLTQVLALSTENQRFFFERALDDHFWEEDSWFYFKHSALSARVGELASLREGVPGAAHSFAPIPLTTYSLLGPPLNMPRSLAPIWMRNFQIFYLPRPWPLWMSWLPRDSRPIDIAPWLAGLLGLSLFGGGLILRECAGGKLE